MAARAAARRRAAPPPVATDPCNSCGHIRYSLGNGLFCSCGRSGGCFSIGLTGSFDEQVYFQAEFAFFGHLREHGFQALNGALVAAVEAVQAAYAQR